MARTSYASACRQPAAISLAIWQAVAALLRSSAMNMACPAALDPGVEFFEAPVQHCSGGSGSNNFYGKGLVDALAASQ